MNIVYGVSGEGFGHSSRAKEIIPFLLKKGHRILVVTYGQAYDVLKDYKGIKILKVEGISLYFKEGKGLSLKRTLFHNLKKIGRNITNFDSIFNDVKEFSPDIAISDMEPIVPILRYWMKLPLICFDNQHRITHLKIDVPKKFKKDFKIAKYSVDRVVSKADFYIILSFIKRTIRENKKKVRVVNPILREKVVKMKSRRGKFILVYLTKKDERILKVLEEINEDFFIYGWGVNKKRKNLTFKKTGDGFLKDLARCKCVIASAGFTLMSEALYLKKPYFAIPLKGQFEQTLNALFLEEAGYGNYSEEPNKLEIDRFLGNLREYEEKLKEYKIDTKEVFKAFEDAFERMGLD